MFCISDQKWMKKHSPFCQNQPLWRDTLAEVSSNHHTALKKKTANTVMATPQKLSVGCTLGTRKQRENQGTNSLRKQTHSRTLPAQSFFLKVRLVFLNNNHTHAHTHTHTHTHNTHTPTFPVLRQSWICRIPTGLCGELQSSGKRLHNLEWMPALAMTPFSSSTCSSRPPSSDWKLAIGKPTSLQGFPQGHCRLLYTDSRFPTGPLRTAEQPTSPQGFKHGHYRLLSSLHHLKDSNMAIEDCSLLPRGFSHGQCRLRSNLHHLKVFPTCLSVSVEQDPGPLNTFFNTAHRCSLFDSQLEK